MSSSTTCLCIQLDDIKCKSFFRCQQQADDDDDETEKTKLASLHIQVGHIDDDDERAHAQNNSVSQ